MSPLPDPTGHDLSSAFVEESDDFELVHETTTPARHGYAYVLVFKRKADGTFWKVHGRSASDNDYNTLRDSPEEVTPIQVVERQRTITEYVVDKVTQAVAAASQPWPRLVASP